MDWQRQSFAKGGKPEAAPSQMNPKTWGGPAPSMNSKIAKPTHPCGGMVKGGGMANGGMVRGYADGGEVDESALKAEGMKQSAGESVGFFKRLSMGNIDQEGSEAYNQFGAGRAKASAAAKAIGDEDEAVRSSIAADRAKPAPEPAKAEEPEAKYGRDSVRDVTPAKAEAPAPAPAPVKTAARTIKPSPVKAEAPKVSLAQSKGAEYTTLEKIAREAESNAGVSAAAKAAARANADRARKTYEAAADAEKTGRSVVFKR